jgi:hypothetical protein
MLAAHHRFPSRGSMAAPTHARGRTEGPMLTPPPPEPPSGMFRGDGAPVQNLVGTALRELWTSMLDAGTAVRLGGNSARPRYFGTVLPSPQKWLSPSDPNSEDSVRAGVKNGGNAPQMVNKTAAQGSPPRIASTLPQRRR